MVQLIRHDLEFILKQIKIAEAHSNGIALTEIRLDANGAVITDPAWYTSADFDAAAQRAIPDPKTPFGLRTVDGSYNNIVGGRELWGAADQPMPRMLDPNFINDADGDIMPLGAPGGPAVTNNNYDVIGTPSGANGGHTGNVADADPRIISNLVVDMSFNNPAAIVAALTIAGSEHIYAGPNGGPGDLQQIRDAHATLMQVLSSGATQEEKDAAQTEFDTLLAEKGIEAQNGSLVIPNVAPDEGLSAPFSSWMTFFGQFFDHGLDLINKGGNGTVFIPLAADDPLRTHGPDGIPGTGDEVQPQNAFMVLTRATPVAGPGPDGVMGTADDTTHEAINQTTPFVDQNQTYTSHASHQVFLREYATVDGKTVATGRLLDGSSNGLPTWADVKANALQYLGIQLTDGDVVNLPLLRTDPYGKFIPDGNGYAQVIVGLGDDGTPNTDDDIVVSGTPDAPVNTFTVNAIRTGHAFLDDIAHNANPINSQTGALKNADTDGVVNGDLNGNGVIDGAEVAPAAPSFYDNELLDRHFITGDGRGNENIGLTAVHHVFHSEHNRQIELQKKTILATGDLNFINEWLLSPISTIPGELETLTWNGERLFQAARFATEMQYQHLVFEEFARKIQPNIDPFVFNSVTDINPAIFAEFAHTVYRFGHSMLNENIDLVSNDGTKSEIGLIEAFLNPLAFDALGSHDEAAAAIAHGMSMQRGNEIDEFITGALRNNLLGLPLDLASINIARGRDTGVPSLNDARTQLFAATGSSFLEPYKNWVDFAANLKNPLSVVNFIAAYGTHASITGATTFEAKRAAAWDLVFGVTGETTEARAERIAWLNASAAETGVNDIDLWIGGLAEKKMPFGGFLGSTFNAVFEAQLENLQDGDRFYYLTRTQGLNFLNALEQNSFSKMILANTALSDPGPDGIRGTSDDIVARHIGIDVFARYDHYLEVNSAMQLEPDPVGNDPVLEGMGRGKVQRDDPLTPGADTNYIRFTGGEHVVIGGTQGDDVIISDFGDDAIWGGAGNDRIEAGAGVDLVNGGAGDDIITDSGDSGDFLKGEDGNDVIANSNGLDILMGGSGKDVIFVGVDDTEVFGGPGDDFILGGDAVDFLMGNEGDDWIEGGRGFDTIAGDNSELFFNSTIIGHDVMFAGSDEQDFDAESGDDIMVQGESVMRNEGMFGFDWATFQGADIDGYADMRIKIFTTEEEDILRNRFDKVEALSGWERNDTLIGDDRVASDAVEDDDDGGVGEGTDAPVGAANENVFFNDELSQAGVNRIDGLRELLGSLIEDAPAGATAAELEEIVAFTGGNILLGGGGSDMLQGNGGDDFLDGDAWLNVRIRITAPGADNTAANEIATITSLKHVFPADFGIAAWQGRSLFELMIDRVIVPTQLHIVREILDGGAAGDVDTAVFWDVRANYELAPTGDGGVIVRHVTQTAGVIDPTTGQNRVSDGVDRVYNVERLQFADTVLNTAGLFNTPATGAPVINDLSPTQGQTLTANLAGIGDAEGINQASLTIRWQALIAGVWTDIAGATTANFTPTISQVNTQLRVVVRFVDGEGNQEEVVSAVTQPVGIQFIGGNGADTFPGTAGADLIEGRGGNDNLSGLGGDDVINGEGGNDTLNGGDGNDVLSGGNGTDTLNGDAGDDTLSGDAGNDTLNGGTGNDTLAGGAGTDTLNGGDGNDNLSGDAGNDTLNGDAGDDTLAGGDGNDTINGGAGDDTVVWNVGDDRDIVDGGTNGAAGDTIVINGDASNETFRVYTRDAWDAVPNNNVNNLHALTQIVVTRGGTNNASIIAELRGVEEIVINTGAGNDQVLMFGDFSPTDLNVNTITVNGDAGNDTVDIAGLLSAHRILFRSNGGNDTIIGALRPQDVVELAPGQDLSTYSLVDNGNGTSTFTNGTHSVTFSGAIPPQFQNTPPPAGNDEGVSGAFEYTASDLAGLKALVNGQTPPSAGDDDVPAGVRNLSGHGNNEGNPAWGAADEPFIRITNARYGEPDEFGNRAVNPVFDGLDPRTISNILGTQEANLPKAGNDANIFFMAMGQYIDHGLDFIGKGGNGTIQIGAPGGGQPGSGNPADLTRGTVAGYENGVPQHINRTSPYVDQNQAYGSNVLVGQFLREGDGNGGLGSHLFAGQPDPSNPNFSLLPTLRELIHEHWNNNTVFHSDTLPGGQTAFRDYFPGLVVGGVINQAMLPGLISNFMGSQHALLLDTNPFINVLDHYVAGDGRTNENFALTSIHTIWARNHNFHVEGLKAAGFQGTAEELFQAAKMVNEAEYQRVVFDEYLETLLGGLRSEGTHGFDEYNPAVNAGISHEFAGAVFRFGHSLIGQTMTILDEDGKPTQVQLFDAFLNPSNDPAVFPVDPSGFYTPQPGYAQHGVNAIIGGTVSQPAENVDFNIVDAVRNDLVRISADLFAFNVARGWDLGIGTLNQVRMDLSASADPYVSEAVGFAGGDLSPYTSWEDFQQRNGLSNSVIEQFKQAYPDLVLAAEDIAAFQQVNPDIQVAMQPDGTGIVKGIDRVDLWVGGLAEKHINGGIVGQTFWVVLHEQFERLQDGDRFYYISRFDDFDLYENFIDGQEFADIVARNTGMTNLPEHMFEVDEIDDDDDNADQGDDDDDDDDTVGQGDDDDDDDDDDTGQGDDDDDDDDDTTGQGDDDDDDAGVTPVPSGGALRTGTPLADVLVGTAGDDTMVAFAGEDVLVGGDGADAISAGEDGDFVNAGAGRDVVFAGAGDDQVLGGAGDDMIYGDAGNDRLFGDEGNDFLNGGAGDDTVFGGAGDDLFVAEPGDGNDVYFGDDSGGGSGTDTLDMSAATQDVTVNLGSGPLAKGYAISAQTGHDVLWGIENVNTGTGDDTIIASNAVNVIDGGAGNDTFVFVTVAAADGDRILGFEPGDRLDLSGIDADAGSAGDQGFTLISEAAFSAAGQLAVSHVSRADGDFTLVQGNVSGGPDADFTIEIEGHRTLTGSNFNL